MKKETVVERAHEEGRDRGRWSELRRERERGRGRRVRRERKRQREQNKTS